VIIHEDIEPILHAQVVLEIVKHSNTMRERSSKSEFTGVFCTITRYMQHYTVRGGFRGGVRGVRPPKIRKAYVIQR
jgi:hypothetical protein